MTPEISVRRVEHYFSRCFREAMRIYHAEFPADSRLSLARIRQLLKSEQYQLYVAQPQETEGVRAFALVWICPRPAFVHLDYLAVEREWKGRGIGTSLYRWLIAHMGELAPRAQLLTLEVEDALIEFYRRSQTHLVQNVPYLFPGPSGPIPMHLMVHDRQGRKTLKRAVVQNIIRALYGGLHRRAADDPLLQSFLPQLPSHAHLR
jgi:ribosomal protein S18 acetylase RimI-like enzyme